MVDCDIHAAVVILENMQLWCIICGVCIHIYYVRKIQYSYWGLYTLPPEANGSFSHISKKALPVYNIPFGSH